MAPSKRRTRTRTGGFTLIEIMFVVAIIGVLAATAVPVFLKYQLRTKSAEAKTNLGTIRVLEHSYFSEHNAFLAVPAEPPLVPGASAVAFNDGAGFFDLGFRPEGKVYFSYGVGITAQGTGYTVDAAADVDGDGFTQFWGFTMPDGNGNRAAGEVGCNVAALIVDQIGPCHPTHGTSVF
jgi:type IV pilus assembly protein PilA